MGKGKNERRYRGDRSWPRMPEHFGLGGGNASAAQWGEEGSTQNSSSINDASQENMGKESLRNLGSGNTWNLRMPKKPLFFKKEPLCLSGRL